ncbi:tyrosine-type recombinase/integrase [Acidocella facilis]|uniref:tyrosine-type recombinase/integrase n=1 Tax=Acidocella facilis TaxID=525 RepID=UPI001F248463|nr:site-specific integrase [Acidocella facilis]
MSPDLKCESAMRLTEKAIDDLKVEPGRRDRLAFDDVTRGLGVRVTASGGKTFILQYTFEGTKRRMPIGAVSAITLRDARAAARALLGEVALGRDPAAERRARVEAAKAARRRQAYTLNALIDDWRKEHLAERRPSYAAEATRALRVAFLHRLESGAELLTRDDARRILAALPKAMRARTAAYGRACFSWAVKHGKMDANPFEALPFAAPKSRDRVLSDDELRAVWRAAKGDHSRYGRIVQLLILTGQRRTEVAGMRWAELSPDRRTWTIGAERAKNSKASIVPLNDPAREIIEAIPAGGDLVFGTRRGRDGAEVAFDGFSKCKLDLDAAAGLSEPWRLHDLRRTVATGLQALGVRLEVTEAILNHVSGSRAGIVGIYQRHEWADEKRAALDAWGRRVLEIEQCLGKGGNVLDLEARRNRQ